LPEIAVAKNWPSFLWCVDIEYGIVYHMTALRDYFL
jgi:hypothetical protein